MKLPALLDSQFSLQIALIFIKGRPGRYSTYRMTSYGNSHVKFDVSDEVTRSLAQPHSLVVPCAAKVNTGDHNLQNPFSSL